MKALELADCLDQHAEHHFDAAQDGDMPPCKTRNWDHFVTSKNAAAELRRLAAVEAELERIKALPPVAWYAPALDGRSVSYFDGKPMIMVGPTGNECHTEPLYTLGSKT